MLCQTPAGTAPAQHWSSKGCMGCKRTLPAGITLKGLLVIPTNMRSHKEVRRCTPNFKGYSYTCLIGHYSHYTLHCCQTAIFLPRLLSPKMLWQKSSQDGKRLKKQQSQTPRIQIPKRCVMEWNLRITNERGCFGDTSPQLETEMWECLCLYSSCLRVRLVEL